MLGNLEQTIGQIGQDVAATRQNEIFRMLPFEGQPGTGALWTYYDAVPSENVPSEIALTPRGRIVLLAGGALIAAYLLL